MIGRALDSRWATSASCCRISFLSSSCIAVHKVSYPSPLCSLRLSIGSIFSILQPNVLDEEQVRDHYDRGDDFYAWSHGRCMVYTSGIISDPSKEETLKQMQDNKLAIVCEKIGLKSGESLLEIGCGWGALPVFASVNYGAKVTGITLGRNQTAWGNKWLRETSVPQEQSQILCMDYRDIPAGKYDKITCLEMAEHVGIRKITSFFRQIYNLLEDDGVFYLQIAGLGKPWQFEDLVWGMFMNKCLSWS